MEKHKMNVPETMNEFLDLSDDEGTLNPSSTLNPTSFLLVTFPCNSMFFFISERWIDMFFLVSARFV